MIEAFFDQWNADWRVSIGIGPGTSCPCLAYHLNANWPSQSDAFPLMSRFSSLTPVYLRTAVSSTIQRLRCKSADSSAPPASPPR